MNVIALESLKYKKKWRVPGTDSAEFTFDKKDKKIAEELLKAKKVCLPQTLEQASQSGGQQGADQLIAEAEGKAKEIIANAEAQAKEIIEKAGDAKK